LASYDVTDQAIINASPRVVWAALHAEFSGKTDWWMPYWEARARGGIPPGNVGTEYEVQVHPPGRFRQMLLSPRFTSRVTELTEPEHLAVEFTEGDFSGTGVWTLSPLNDVTRLRFEWKVSTRGRRATFVGLFVNIGEVHSFVMQQGFKGLNKHLQAPGYQTTDLPPS
jgi:hypothetical protein